MQIKEIELEDIAAVYTLGKTAFVDDNGGESFVYNYWSLQQLAHILEEYPEYSLVCYENEILVGFVLGHPTYEGIVDVGYLEWLAVHPSHRGKGIASKLVQTLLEIYKENGETRVVTDVKGINAPSTHIFKNKFGFTEKETVSFLLREL